MNKIAKAIAFTAFVVCTKANAENVIAKGIYDTNTMKIIEITFNTTDPEKINYCLKIIN